MTTVVLHGAQRPAESVMSVLVRDLRARVGTDAEFVEAFETAGAAKGAAANVSAALAHSTGTQVLVVAVDPQGRTTAVEALFDAARQRNCLAIAEASCQVSRWKAVAATSDLVKAIAADVSGVFAGQPGAARAAFVPAWAAPRALIDRAGGLDGRWLHLGEALDLALRVLDSGGVVETVSVTGPASHDVYPLPEAVADLLAWQHAALIALERPGVEESGRLTAWVASQALAEAWRAADIDTEALRFGGAWPAQVRADRWLGRSGLRRNATFWPKDEPGTVVPYLALDAAIERFTRGEAGRPVVSHGTDQNNPRANGGGAATGDPAPKRSASGETPSATAVVGSDHPMVSVIVVNWNGDEHLTPCFASLLASDYPANRLELICVDNGSTDGSRPLLAATFPTVKVVALDENRGFTGGNIAGVEVARGTVFAFFNNDMRVAPDAVRRLVEALDDVHPCAAARVLSWDGQRIDFVRGTLNFEARGFQENYGDSVRPELCAAGETFFANGGAFAITREAYERAGGFDASLFAYYDDTDLGWGVRINGGAIPVVPEAVAYHRHGATAGRWPAGQKQFLMERNAVWTAVKRYGEGTLTRVLGPLLLLAARRVAQDAAVDASSPLGRALGSFAPRVRGRRAATAWTYSCDAVDGSAFLVRLTIESVAALGEAVRGLAPLVARRRAIQQARRVDDAQVLPRFGRALEALSSRKTYRDAHDALVARFGLEHCFRPRTRVLLITHDPLRANMSGPGVRVLEMGRALSRACEVTVATPFEPETRDSRVRVAQYTLSDPNSLSPLAEQADVVVVQGFTLYRFPLIRRLPAQIVVDLYCPFTIEHLEMRTSAVAHAPGSAAALAPEAIHNEAAGILEAMNQQLRVGDYFICASERQRDFWVGALQTAGRINTLTYAADPTLRALIDVVPFGLPDEPPPPKSRQVMKGTIPGIDPGDQVILWAGSLLDWQDPQGLVRAVARLAQTHPRAKLVFMGTRHPNPDVPLQRAVEESMAVARETGVLGRHVFFNDWVPYAERHEWLLEADLGVTTHRDHLETRFAYRTRMLDYVWANLPVVCTRGDVFADLVEQEGLGMTVPAGDENALITALGRMLDDGAMRAQCADRLEGLADRMRWAEVVAPLRRFCEAPWHAADHVPAKRAYRRRLEQKYRVSKWLKRTALRVGVSEGRIEQVKQVDVVRRVLVWRNKLALARAQRGR